VQQVAAWRHAKLRGGYVLEYGVHDADLFLFFMGDVERVYAETHLWEQKRFTGDAPLVGHLRQFYGHRVKEAEEAGAVERLQDDAIWYFGYGSNMSRSIFVERRRMRPLATRSARLDDYRLCFNIPIGPGERGVANLQAQTGARTHGVLYLLAAADFDRLDRTEGVQFGVYRRIPVEVTLDDAQRVAAVTYQSSLTQDARKPSARYMGLLLEGARQHGLPGEYLRFLQSFELAHDEREAQGA
jgi:cation transport regulator ChaC